MSGTRKIRFLSASDRINYGDFLFPLIFKEELKRVNNTLVFENYGVVKSDFRHFGALKTKSFRDLEAEIEEGDKLVLGGGEIFFANWVTIYAFINPRFRFFLRFKKLKKLERKIKFSNRLLSKNQVLFPFLFEALDFSLSEIKVYYSSVGGGSLLLKDNKIKDQAYKRLKSAKLISLRDNRSYNYFLPHSDLKVNLIPDSALLMSMFYSKQKLKATVGVNLKYENYIFLQLGLKKGPKNLREFGGLVENLAQTLNCKVVLCPIGLAPGHEDDKILLKLKELKPHFDLVLPKSIFEIMFLISNSNLYLGTSLHGAITAMSFLVPAIGLNKNISKLESYMRTWVSNDFINLDFESVNFMEVHRLVNLFHISYNKEKLLNQQRLIQSNLEKIIND